MTTDGFHASGTDMSDFQRNLIATGSRRPDGYFIVILNTVLPQVLEGVAVPSLNHPSRWEEKEFEALVVAGILECDGHATAFTAPEGKHENSVFLVYLAKVAKGDLPAAAARNELAAIRLYLESCGLEEGETIIHFLRGWKQNGVPCTAA